MRAVDCAEATMEAVRTPEKQEKRPTKPTEAASPAISTMQQQQEEGVSGSCSYVSFDRIDTNHDGVIDRREWRQACTSGSGGGVERRLPGWDKPMMDAMTQGPCLDSDGSKVIALYGHSTLDSTPQQAFSQCMNEWLLPYMDTQPSILLPSRPFHNP